MDLIEISELYKKEVNNNFPSRANSSFLDSIKLKLIFFKAEIEGKYYEFIYKLTDIKPNYRI